MKRYTLFALVLLGILGCSGLKEEISGQAGNDNQAGNDGSMTLTTTVSMGETRALTADGVKTFSPGDQVAVVYTGKSFSIETEKKAVSEPLSAENIFDGGKKALITVTLNNPTAGGSLRIVYPASMASGSRGDVDYAALASQDGTLASLAAGLDLSIYTGNLTSGGTLPSSVTLANQLAITALTIEDEQGGDITSNVTNLTINDGTNGYSVSRTASAGPIYVAMQPVSSGQTLRFSANTGSDYYLKTVTGKTLEAGKLYPVEVSMNPDVTGLSVPLTIEARTGGATVGFHKATSLNVNVQYSLNGGPWTDYSSSIVLANAGDKVSFRGNNATYAKYQSSSYLYSYFFSDYQECYLYGNVMSLVNATGFATEDKITESYAFYRLFASEPHFLSHETRELLLPATTLSTFCYDSMFEGSTGLTRAPALPAEHVAQFCYQEMFKDCTGLTEVPALSATALESYCCRSMFSGCTSLQTAPALPAETLTSECYAHMFSGCSSLINPPELPATTLATSCYLQMFMDCTSLQTAPVLPAPTLQNRCYQNMFWGCTNLTRIVCLATDHSATDCTTSWLYKASSTGTFVKPASVSWTEGTDGIPAGWTTEDYVAP